MIIGSVSMVELSGRIMKAEKRICRETNPVIFPRKEVEKKLKVGHHFLKTVLEEEKILIVGKADEMETGLGKRLA